MRRAATAERRLRQLQRALDKEEARELSRVAADFSFKAARRQSAGGSLSDWDRTSAIC